MDWNFQLNDDQSTDQTDKKDSKHGNTKERSTIVMKIITIEATVANAILSFLGINLFNVFFCPDTLTIIRNMTFTYS